MAKDQKINKTEEFEQETPELEAFSEETGEPGTDFGEIFAAWQFPEHVLHEKGKKWYIYFALLLLVALVISIFGLTIPLFPIAGKWTGIYFDSSPLFIIILVLFIFLYIFIERKEVENIGIALTEDGILLNDKLIEYRDFQNFYIIYYPPKIKNLYLQPKNILKQLIVVPLENENPVVVRRALLQYLPEDIAKEEIPPTEAISRLLKL